MDIEALSKLAELKDKGILTEEEFNQQKQKILNTLDSVSNVSVSVTATDNSDAKKVNSNFAWALAFAPMLGLMLEVFLEELTEAEEDTFWFVTICLNILFSYLDANELKKSGYNSKMLDNAWFVPGYLWERSQLLKETPIYLIIWSILFILFLF